jgi:hypothetical protein
VLAALGLDADRLPTPRADGDREALRILLGARDELTVVTTRADQPAPWLLGGDDTDREKARATLTDPALVGLARRRRSPVASREQAVRHHEIRRLARAVRAGRRALMANRAQLQTSWRRWHPG